MSDTNSPEEKDSVPKSGKKDEKAFIRERIAEKPKKKHSFLKAVLLVCVLGVLFGVIAAISFFVSGNVIKGTVKTAEETHESVSIPRDQLPTEAPTETESVTETPAPTEEETTPEEVDDEAFRESVEGILRDYLRAKEAETSRETEPASVEKVKEIRNILKHNLVTVTSQQAEEDVFNHTYTRSQETFGLIVAVTGRDVRILTESYLLEDADSVRITFGNGSVCDASLMEQDDLSGMAVVSVPTAALSDADSTYILPAVLGNSYQCNAGDMVVALGRPLDYLPSVAWGIISYIEEGVQGTDFNYDIIRT